jgi:hypothetical protein
VLWLENVKGFAPVKHYCLFTIDGDRVGITVYGETGQVFDHIDNLTDIKGN